MDWTAIVVALILSAPAYLGAWVALRTRKEVASVKGDVAEVHKVVNSQATALRGISESKILARDITIAELRELLEHPGMQPPEEP